MFPFDDVIMVSTIPAHGIAPLPNVDQIRVAYIHVRAREWNDTVMPQYISGSTVYFVKKVRKH